MRPAFTITHESATVIHAGTPHTFLKGSIQYSAIHSAVLSEDWDGVVRSLTLAGSLAQWAKGRFAASADGKIFYDGEPLPISIQGRIREMAAQGESPEPVFNFYERLAKNPSHRSVNQLFNFLQHSGIPLQKDGTFLAYKGVKADLTDCYTGKVDNSPGVVNRMERNLVSDDPQTACHFGYHVGDLSYADSFHSDGAVVICEVDPEHVVCVPNDESYRKMRVCEYKVIGHHAGGLLSSTVHSEEIDEDDDEEWREGDSAHDEPADVRAEAVHVSDQGKAAYNKARRFARLSGKDLMNESLADLRKYAAGPCKIVGASKLPGGKSALVGKILKYRKKKAK